MQKFILVGALACSGLLSGCMGGMGSSSADRAEAQLAPTQGNKVSGTVTFVQSGAKLKVFAEVSGLTPGLHGFHIHEKGDCSAPDGTSAGGHFNPTNKPHGNPERGEHHAGDMVQLVADEKGIARQVSYIEGPTLGEGPGNIIGRSVIVHTTLDDYKTQPTGNSGGRQACGVIVKK
ncbi:MAG: superoxide dismutase family protein [Candidatus Dechloromonas phosphoritropha]|nr:superoxide dismutase family protein [Candidatus Dechloromonas phosphoritropha]MBP8787538.1 superoxide dismutase family protein [Azonexus sp.]